MKANFKSVQKRVIIGLLLDKRDESKTPYEVIVISYNDTQALILHFGNVWLCDIVLINGEQFLRRKTEVLECDEYITL